MTEKTESIDVNSTPLINSCLRKNKLKILVKDLWAGESWEKIILVERTKHRENMSKRKMNCNPWESSDYCIIATIANLDAAILRICVIIIKNYFQL